MEIKTPQQAAEVFGLIWPEGIDRPIGNTMIAIAQTISDLRDRAEQAEERLKRIEADLYPEENTEELKKVWAFNGALLGYPPCCIDSFCQGKGWEAATEEQRRASKNHFIPCHDHAVRILSGEITIESIIGERGPGIPAFGMDI